MGSNTQVPNQPRNRSSHLVSLRTAAPSPIMAMSLCYQATVPVPWVSIALTFPGSTCASLRAVMITACCEGPCGAVCEELRPSWHDVQAKCEVCARSGAMRRSAGSRLYPKTQKPKVILVCRSLPTDYRKWLERGKTGDQNSQK